MKCGAPAARIFVKFGAPTAPIFMKFAIFRKSVEKIQVSSKSDTNNGTLHEDQCAFSISRPVLLRMRNVSDKRCRCDILLPITDNL
jgi:hypothetical protein